MLTLPLARVIEWAGQTLKRSGRIIYLSSFDREEPSSSSNSRVAKSLRKGGTKNEADVGLLCLIDASECPPTFGAAFEDVRGFLKVRGSEVKGSDRGPRSKGQMSKGQMSIGQKSGVGVS